MLLRRTRRSRISPFVLGFGMLGIPFYGYGWLLPFTGIIVLVYSLVRTRLQAQAGGSNRRLTAPPEAYNSPHHQVRPEYPCSAYHLPATDEYSWQPEPPLPFWLTTSQTCKALLVLSSQLLVYRTKIMTALQKTANARKRRIALFCLSLHSRVSPYRSEPKFSKNPLMPDKHCINKVSLISFLTGISPNDNLVALIIQESN